VHPGNGALIAVSAYAAAGYALYAGLALARVDRAERWSIAGIIALFTIFPLGGGLVRGFPIPVTLAVVGTAGFGMTLGCRGRNERLFGRFLNTPIRVGIGEQTRIAGVLVVYSAIAMPTWLAVLN
jgi:hypothetical protein